MLIWLSSCSHDSGSEHELGEVALSPSPHVLQNELEQLFRGLKPDGAAVQFNRKCRISFCTSKHARRSFKNLDISEVFTLTYDFSAGSICIAQDWSELSPTYAAASNVLGQKNDLVRPMSDRWSYCDDPSVRTSRDIQAGAKRLLPVCCAEPVTFPLMTEHQEYSQNIVFFSFIIQRHVTCRRHLFAARLKSRSGPAKKVNIFSSDILCYSGLCNRCLWQECADKFYYTFTRIKQHENCANTVQKLLESTFSLLSLYTRSF